MKNIKKLVISFLTIAFLIGGCNQVSAATYTRNSGGKSFDKDWSVTAINSLDRTFKYGYNTRFFNEDYTHTYHRHKKNTAYVKNNSRAKTKTVGKGKYAKAEIRHSGSTVYYQYLY